MVSLEHWEQFELLGGCKDRLAHASTRTTQRMTIYGRLEVVRVMIDTGDGEEDGGAKLLPCDDLLFCSKALRSFKCHHGMRIGSLEEGGTSHLVRK